MGQNGEEWLSVPDLGGQNRSGFAKVKHMFSVGLADFSVSSTNEAYGLILVQADRANIVNGLFISHAAFDPKHKIALGCFNQFISGSLFFELLIARNLFVQAC